MGRSAGRRTRVLRRRTRRTGTRVRIASYVVGLPLADCWKSGSSTDSDRRDARRGPRFASRRARRHASPPAGCARRAHRRAADRGERLGQIDVLGHRRRGAPRGRRDRRPRAGRGCRCRTRSACPGIRRYSPVCSPLSELKIRYVSRAMPSAVSVCSIVPIMRSTACTDWARRRNAAVDLGDLSTGEPRVPGEPERCMGRQDVEAGRARGLQPREVVRVLTGRACRASGGRTSRARGRTACRSWRRGR